MKQRTGTIRRNKLERRYHDRRDEEERRTVPIITSVNKILVTGDREWNNVSLVVETLKGYRPGTILVHGACRGADFTCAAVAEALGFVVRGYPADWKKHPGRAGPIRNQQMLEMEHWHCDREERIDLCLTFHDHIQDSRGTADMLDRVVRANIPWKLIMSSNVAARTPCTSSAGETSSDG